MKSKIYILVMLSFFACKKDRGTTWDANYLSPIAEGELGIGNLLSDRMTSDTNGNVSLRLQETLYEIEANTIEIPDTVITSYFTLNSLIISDREIVQKVTLGQINPAFALLHGTYQDVPAQSINNASEVPVDASEFFQTAEVKTGFLDMSIYNELPVNISKVVLELRNKSDNSVVVSETFFNVASGQTKNTSVPLDGKTINAELIGVVKEISTEASAGKVLIDVTKGVEMKLAIRDLRPYSAIAAFPTQTIMEQDEGLVLELGEAELKHVLIKSGTMKIDFYTSVREDMTIYFKIPSLTKNGVALEETIPITGASPGSPVTVTRNYPLKGYWMDYRGKNPDVTDTVNTFHQILNVTLDSSGRQLPMSLDDSVFMYYGFVDIVPDYAEGYLGNTINRSGDASEAFNELGDLEGDIQLDDAKLTLSFVNYVGAGGKLDINKIASFNSEKNKEVNLTSVVLPTSLNVIPARDNPLRPWTVSYSLNKGNSNIVDFINNVPNEFRYNVDFEMNPNGNISNYKDFIYSDSRTKVEMDLEVPLKFSSTGISLGDTLEVEWPDEKEVEYIKGANLILHINNGFPYSVEPVVSVVGPGSAEELLIETEGVVAPGMTDVDGKVTAKTPSLISLSLTDQQLEWLKKTRKLYLKATIKTPVDGTKVWLNSNYKMDVKVIGDFVYEMGL